MNKLSAFNIFLILASFVNFFIMLNYIEEGNALWAAICGFCIGFCLAYVVGTIVGGIENEIEHIEKEIKGLEEEREKLMEKIREDK